MAEDLRFELAILATVQGFYQKLLRDTLGGDVPIPHILTRTPAEGRAGVDSLVALGVDFVKVHGQLTPETIRASRNPET